MRKSLRILVLVFFGLLLIPVILAVTIVMNEDRIKSVIITELNTYLSAELRVAPSDIDITVLSTFPDCSIRFRKILMLEALPLKVRDTLVFADQLNLYFNIRDIWTGNYSVKKISARGLLAKPVDIDALRNNYTFWKESGSDSENELAFRLAAVKIEDLRLKYRNLASRDAADISFRTVRLSGDFSSKTLDLGIKTDCYINEILKDKKALAAGKELILDLDLSQNGDNYNISRASAALNEVRLRVQGNFTYGDSLSHAQLDFEAEKLDIKGLISLLPDSVRNRLMNYEASGELFTKGELKYSGKKDYVVSADFGIHKGSVYNSGSKGEARNIELKGNFSYSPSRQILQVSSASLAIRGGWIKSSLKVTDFNDPHLDLQAESDVRLEDLHAMLPADTINSLTGDLWLRLALKGKTRDISKKISSPLVSLSLESKVRNAELSFKNGRTFKVPSGSVKTMNKSIEVAGFRILTGRSDLTIDGSVPELLNYYSGAVNHLSVKGTLRADSICVDDFMSRTKQKSAQPAEYLIPPDIRLQLGMQIGKLSFGDFIAREIRGDLEIKNRNAILNETSLRTMNGNSRLNLFVDNSRDHLDLVLQGDLDNIDIRQLFTAMHNFDQSTLQDKNLNGTLNAVVSFSGRWSNTFEPDLRSMKADIDLGIMNGQLNDFSPLLSLSRFIDVKDLQRISFSSLSAKVRIENEAVILPKTVINNSALNLEVWGTHYFNNTIDYHISLLLSELLAKKLKKQDEEFGPVENDPENRRRAFILMTGTVDDPVIRYDRKGMKQKIREDIREEKKSLKQMLREEFASVKKEESVPSAGPPEKAGESKPLKKLELKKKEEDDDF